MNQLDLDIFIAKTQRSVAFLLIIGLIAMVFGIGFLLVAPWPVNDKLITLGVTLATGLLTLSGQPVAYLFMRHRPPSLSDGNGDTPAPLVPQPPEMPK